MLADFRSRIFSDHLEWPLTPVIFQDICNIFGSPEVDLFASQLNLKLPKYVSWEPDPHSWHTDAFAFSWTYIYIYIYKYIYI